MKAFFLLLISLNSFAQCGFWVKDKTEFSEWITTDTISSSTDTTDTSRHGSVILSNSKISYIENLPAKQVYSYKGTFTTINLDSIKYKTQNFIMGDSSIIINSSSCSITSEIFNAKISNSENVHIINGYTKIRNKPIRINTTRNKIFVWTGKSYKIISI